MRCVHQIRLFRHAALRQSTHFHCYLRRRCRHIRIVIVPQQDVHLVRTTRRNGINVRLISLKREARTNTTGLKNEIASTQRLVIKSAKSVRRVAREFGSL